MVDNKCCAAKTSLHNLKDLTSVPLYCLITQDALHEDLNRHTKYSAPATGIDEETPPNPVATRRAKASGWQRLLIGQSAKRVLTVNTISNASVEKDLEKEEEGDVEPSTVTKSADSATALNPASSPQPMSVEVLSLSIFLSLFLFLFNLSAEFNSAMLPGFMIYISDHTHISF